MYFRKFYCDPFPQSTSDFFERVRNRGTKSMDNHSHEYETLRCQLNGKMHVWKFCRICWETIDYAKTDDKAIK